MILSTSSEAETRHLDGALCGETLVRPPPDHAIVGNQKSSAGKSHFRTQCRTEAAPQQTLYFLPLPQGQGSLRPTLPCIDLATCRS